MKDSQIRRGAQQIATVILLLYFYDIVSNKLFKGIIYLDVNDGLVILSCITVLFKVSYIGHIITSVWNEIIKLISSIRNKIK